MFEMNDDQAIVMIWVFVGVIALLLVFFVLYLISDHYSYSGGQGSDDPRGYNEWTQL